ncbi:hypothetical protein [Bradyrhizobium sp. STM 3557]|uniref:hypothetical protein n=1 Tax=Bradyrhizobium sp. STM 3557 TaxID=578920 RepID=UPI00388DEF03
MPVAFADVRPDDCPPGKSVARFFSLAPSEIDGKRDHQAAPNNSFRKLAQRDTRAVLQPPKILLSFFQNL